MFKSFGVRNSINQKNIHKLASQYTQISIKKNSNHNYTWLPTNSYTYSFFNEHKGDGGHKGKLVESKNGESDRESGEGEHISIAAMGQHVVLTEELLGEGEPNFFVSPISLEGKNRH